MKKTVVVFLLIMSGLCSFAQTDSTAVDSAVVDSAAVDSAVVDSAVVAQLKFGYVSYDSLLAVSPGYSSALEELEQLKAEYDKEMKRVENDFNAKYEAFLEGQADFPRTILLKRQQELQDMLAKNIEFKNSCRRELAQKKRDIQKEHRSIIRGLVASEAQINHLAFVLNTDEDACLFIDLEQGLDLQEAVKSRLLLLGSSSE